MRWSLLLLLGLVGCDRSDSASAPTSASTSTSVAAAASDSAAGPASASGSASAPSSASASGSAAAPASASASPSAPAPRIVAVGDLHGDFEATVELLRLAKLIDVEDAWVGGKARLVQVGDILDRGGGEREILDLLDRLRGEAKAAGGAVHVVNGNHELMNTAGRFLYVSNDGLGDFAEFDDGDPSLTIYPKDKRGRWAAFRPGGPYAKRLADNPIILELDGTLFIHGGLLPKHLDIGIEKLNRRARDFLLGTDTEAWGFFADWDSPLNMRHYSKAPNPADCALLAETLRRTGTERMVVGHTPQIGGVKSYCHERVWVVDVGIGRCCGNNREALEIVGGEVKPLRYPPGPPPMIRGRPMPR